MKRKQYLLIGVVILIVGGIYYLQSMKAVPSAAPDEPTVRTEVEATPEQEMLPEGYILDEAVIAVKEQELQRAPELVGISGYINTEPGLKLADLRGTVVLVDIWTYTCINCIRTLPFIRTWYEKYEDQGLEIVGVHTPEFEFEKDYDNVLAAVEKYELQHPIVQDNDFQTWRAFKNRYWPRKYLIDIDGFIRYDHIGEGGYEETEGVIQELLDERRARLGEAALDNDLSAPEDVVDVEFNRIGTPEIYFGYGFTRGNFGNPEGFKPGQIVEYVLPDELAKSKAYIEGSWRNDNDGMELISDTGKVVLHYRSKVVNIVAGADEPSVVTVRVDGELVDSFAGAHVSQNMATVQEHDLYNVVDGTYEDHFLELDVEKGFRIFTFTFG